MEQHCGGQARGVRLAADPSVRKAAADVVRPLQSAGIERFEVRRGQQVIETVTQDDLPAFAATNAVIEKEIQGVDAERTAALEVVKPSFEDSLTWTFSDGSGGHINARMKDARFLQKRGNRGIAFANGDILRVRLASRTYVTPGGLGTDNVVVEVLDVIAQARQLSMRE